MKHNIIKSITLSYLCMIIFCTLSGCRAHDQNTSNNISTETEADFKETAVFEESREVIDGFLEDNYNTANELPIDLFADNAALETQKIPEVTDTLLDMLIENVKSMRPVMNWFVYGCDVIGYEEDIKYFKDNGYYFLINDPVFSEAGINSIESLKDYLHQFFTAEYTESIMEQRSMMFLEADGELYILAASAAPSALYIVESASAVYICDNEIKLTFDTTFKLFNAEPKPTALEFTFILEDGKWLCNSSPDLFSCVKIYLNE